MNEKKRILTFGVLLLFGWSAGAQEHTQGAEFWVGQTIVHTNPAGFGAEIKHLQRVNNWTDNPGMEPMEASEYWELTGGGTDATGDYAACSTRMWDTLSSGYYDGGHYRLYRENMVAGRIEKIREGTIPTGGFIADGYMDVGGGSQAIKAYAPNTEATDDFYIENGQTWYYAVKATDIDGKVSGFSAAAAGVSPQTGITNGPRIKTQQVSDPVVGQNYGSFATLTALGGDLPLTWTVASGALPAGMTLDSAGKISGTCSSSNEITFVARVTDNSANTHERIFTMFRPDPTGDGSDPSAPANVTTEANDGFVHVSWDTPSETDIVSYQLYRSHQPESQHMERIYLEGSGTIPASNDLLFVEKKVLFEMPLETRSVRVIQYQDDPTLWLTRGNAATTEIVAHPGVLPAAFTNEHSGEGCLKLSTSADEMFAIRQYKYSSTDGEWWGAGQFPTGQTYRMECWVYGEGLTDDSLRFVCPNYADETVNGIVNGAWTKLSADFTVSNWLTNVAGIFGPEFQFEGPGTVYIDNAVVYNVNDPGGAGSFSEHIFDLWTDYIGPTNRAQKGVMRMRAVDDPFENIVNPPVMSMRINALTSGTYKTEDMHLGALLEAAFRTGSSPETRVIPWMSANLEWSETNYVSLIEYLAGPAGTRYGDVRISQRGGVTTPWTDEFRKIFIEMGNEPWNNAYFFHFRDGVSEEAGRTYGRWCQYIWDHVWTNSAYMTDVIKPVLGGWNGSRTTNGFTATARRECPRSDHVGMTLYMGGWEAGQDGQVGGTTWNDDGVQQWPVYLDRNGQAVVDGSVQLQAEMAAEGLPFEWVVYESGPSYMQNGLNGVSLTEEEQAISKKYGRTLAAAIGSLDFYMYGAYRNIQEMAFFQFVEDRYNWASHTYVHEGYRPHPIFQALGLYNRQIGPDSMRVTAPLSMPVFDLEYEKDGETVVDSDVALASAYAFSEGNRHTVLLLNKKVDGIHNGYDFGDGCTPATLHLPFTSPDSIMLYKLDGDPRETNMDQMNVQVVTQSIDTVYFSPEFVVDENTGGETNGLPTGAVFIYVFEGCTTDSLPANPQVWINQAPQQADPQNGSLLNEVRFTVIFDRPVTGFDSANDVTLGGTAMPQTAMIEEDPSSFGTIYEVTVSGMAAVGTVTLSVPADAAVGGGNGNDVSTAMDHSVTVEFPDGVSLVEWEFLNKDELSVPPAQEPAATLVHPKLAPVSLAVGPDASLETGNIYYNNDAFALRDLRSSSLNTGDYVGWTLTPTNGWEMSMDTLLLGAFCLVNVDYDVELRWSDDGFSSHQTVTLTPANPLDGGTIASDGGTELQGDLSGVSGLQNTTNAVEFRFYIWNTGGSYPGLAGIGKLGDDVVDLQIKGAVVQVGSADDDGDGLPNWWELQYFGGVTNANPGAFASNGFNTVEDAYIAGFDPTDPAAAFLMSNLQALTAESILEWTGVSGRVYTVYWTSNLLSGFGGALTNGLSWTPGIFTDGTHSAEQKGFYKIEVELE